jgi:hypothetical protein
MTNPLPSPPKPENPRFGQTWFDDSYGDFLAWDGEEWVPLEDMPPWPSGKEPTSKAVYRDKDR